MNKVAGGVRLLQGSVCTVLYVHTRNTKCTQFEVLETFFHTLLYSHFWLFGIHPGVSRKNGVALLFLLQSTCIYQLSKLHVDFQSSLCVSTNFLYLFKCRKQPKYNHRKRAATVLHPWAQGSHVNSQIQKTLSCLSNMILSSQYKCSCFSVTVRNRQNGHTTYCI